MKFAATRKIGMTRVFNESGEVEVVSILSVIPSKIFALKGKEKDGYSAVVVEENKINALKSDKNSNKGLRNKASKKFEFRVEDEKKYKTGDEIKAETFSAGDSVEVSGTSKGKGYTGAIKRHGYSRGPETHGSGQHRRTGSIGGAFPQRVVKGKKMPGRMGGAGVTTKNLKVIEAENDIILVSGSVPGPKKSIVKIISK